MSGRLTIKKFNQANELLLEIEVPNLVVTSGKRHIAQRVAGYVGSSASVMNYMGIGSNNANLTSANTALGAQIGSRVVLDSTTVNESTVTYAATFGPLAEFVGSIVEAGIFNSVTGETMLCRTTFPPISKSASETIAIVWNVTVG